MAASFPGAVKSFTAVVNGITKLVAALFNSPYDEITAIETYLLTAGKVVQVVWTETGSVDTGTVQIPYDDTIPQSTDGDEYMSLAITPTSATNKLKIEVVLNGAFDGGADVTLALFQDGAADALAAVQIGYASGVQNCTSFFHYMTAGTTSPTTFKVRAGAHQSGTFTFNGYGGARKYGGVMASSITITEIQG
jgi:hypothetical protein